MKIDAKRVRPARGRGWSWSWLTGFVLVALLAASCSSSDGDDDELEAGTSTTAADVEDWDPDAEVMVSSTSVPNTLDPHRLASVSPYPYVFQIYDRLTQVDTDRKLKPMLATDWSFSDDGLTLTMELRSDVTFNDGTPLEADAVKASIERAKTITGSFWSAALAAIETVTVVDPHTVQFDLSEHGGELLTIFASPAGVVINPKVLAEGRDLSTDTGRDLGSGPRVVTNFISSDRVEYERADDDYWEPEANRVAKMTLYRITDDSARMNAYRSGQTNVMMVKVPQLAEANALVEQGGHTLHLTEYPISQLVMFFRTTRSDLDKVEVRRAINHAIDRDAIAEQLLDGHCKPGSQLFQEGQPGYDESLEGAYDYDPDEARRLLASAGLEDGFSFQIEVISGQSPNVEVAQVLKEQLAAVNIEANLVAVDSATASKNFNDGQYDSYIVALTDNPDPSMTVNNSLLGGPKVAVPAAPEVADLGLKGRDRRTPEWESAYQEIAKVIQDKALFAPICAPPAIWMSRSDVVNAGTMPWQTSSTYDPRYLYVKR